MEHKDVNKVVGLYAQVREQSLKVLSEKMDDWDDWDGFIDVGVTLGVLSPYYFRADSTSAKNLTQKNPFGFEVRAGDMVGSMDFMPFYLNLKAGSEHLAILHLWFQDLLAYVDATKGGLLPQSKLIKSTTNAAMAGIRKKRCGFEVTDTEGNVLSLEELMKMDPDTAVDVWTTPKKLVEVEPEIRGEAEKAKKLYEIKYRV